MNKEFDFQGIKLDEEFDIVCDDKELMCDNPYKFKHDSRKVILVEKHYREVRGWVILKLLSGEYQIKKRTKVTERQKEILKALYVLGFRWIAKDKVDDFMFAYEEKPFKKNSKWWEIEKGSCINDYDLKSLKELSNLVNWEDSEPLEIEKAIKEV